MKEKKELTGYPHIDKPWMQYYTKDQSEIIIPDINIVTFLKEQNKKNLEGIAETYYGKNISFSELFYNVDLTSRALKELGIKKHDVIVNLLPNIPEAGQIWMATIELGAVSNFIDPRPDSFDPKVNAKKILEILKYEKAKYIVALDVCYLSMLKPIENELKEMGIDSIVIVGSDDSMTLKGKIEYLDDVYRYNKLSNSRKGKSDKISSYKAIKERIEFVKNTKEDLKNSINSSPLKIYKLRNLISECRNSSYERINEGDLVNYIGHTSGTSGSMPKPIALTNKNGIALSLQCEKGGFTPKPGETAFHLLPFFAPAGAFSNYIVNLSNGVELIDIYEFNIRDFGYLIKKHKPNSILATPAWLSLLPEYKLLDNENLDYITKIISCGDSISEDDKKKIDNWLKAHGSNATIDVAHGMSEYGGCGSYGQNAANRPNTIGIPLANTIYSIVDPNVDDKMVPIKFKDGEDRIEGELVVSSPNVTNGKLGDKVVIPHYEMDGESYIRTRDLVEMDKNGEFYYKSRKDRSFVRFDGYKVKPFEIEKVIETNKYVKYARLVEYYEPKNSGLMPICHLVLKDENIDVDSVTIINDIVNNTILNNPEMSSRQIPSKFRIRESLPMTKNNKVDFKALSNEDLDGSEINVDVEETLLDVGNIKVYKDCKTLKLK